MKIKKVLSFVLVFMVAVTIFFGAYQLFIDDVEAILFDCGSSGGCDIYGGGGCGGALGCICTGGPDIWYCWPPQGDLPTG